jgi:hypothetical protein
MTFHINRPPVLTLWAAIVAERLGQPEDTALTLGRAVAGSTARTIGREQSQADKNAETPLLRQEHVSAPVFLLGKEIRLLPTEDGKLRVVDGDKPTSAEEVRRYLDRAFGKHLNAVRQAMELLAGRYEPAELNRIGFGLYEKFRPEAPPGSEGWGALSVLKVESILNAG